MEVFGNIALTIIAVIAALVFAGFILIRACHDLLIYRAVRLMHRSGRFLSRRDFEQRVAASTGTVVFEYPTLGWRVLRVWWTPDDIRSIGQAANLSEQSTDSEGVTPSPFEAWCHDTYTDLDRGHALIVPFYLFGAAYYRFRESLLAGAPSLRSVCVRSASVHFCRTYEPNGNA
jgi:hypothetical protein